MTYGECKEKIRDLGFEENSTITEYESIVRNAVQRALQFLYDDIVVRYKSYYKIELSTPEAEWMPVRPAPVTIDVLDNRVLELPDNIIELVPLLASYFVWLDDDEVKAALYWNAYDAMKQEITTTMTHNTKAVIYGGMRW